MELIGIKPHELVGLWHLWRVTYRKHGMYNYGPNACSGTLTLGLGQHGGAEDRVLQICITEHRGYRMPQDLWKRYCEIRELTDDELTALEDVCVVTPISITVEIRARREGIYMVDEATSQVICEVNPEDAILIWKPKGYTPDWLQPLHAFEPALDGEDCKICRCGFELSHQSHVV